jgi:hypothetical protein
MKIPFIKKIKKFMAQITINDRTVIGGSISITNGRVIIDGVDCTPDMKNINISIVGDVKEVKVGVCNSLKIEGNVNYIQTTSGDVDISGDVNGPVSSTTGDIDCGNVAGNASSTSGDIVCGSVGGSMTTVNGDIEHS